ncbi:OmpA family protein [Rhodospira trueperi]|uniref:OmpA-OmpF porin, OOP family n=1 Tax=Rhodospira trueperi TaxID=69960 RepID=A0A1G7DAK6_9PROT|nr:OmpA family protein [Rhodospira trueperi]SDE48597.1 OmpA-OmpF porin, OOP family [Rhodospira trueperi]
MSMPKTTKPKMTLGRLAAGAALGLAVASPAHALFGFEGVRTMRDADIPADAPTFEEQAIRYYKQFSLFEADRMGDWYDAEHFADKGIAVGHGEAPSPEVAADQGITDPLHLARLNQAREALMHVLTTDGPDIAPKASAFALVSYDCWVEQVQEGHQHQHIEACRTQFRDAMTVLAALDAVDDPSVVAEAVVFFGFDEATLTPDARAVLDELEETLDNPDSVAMRVVGHADRSGSADYNQALSERRAVAVADALTNMGLTVREIDTLALEAQGETAPAVPTGDGVREPRNRRVVVQAVGQSTPDVVVVGAKDMPALESTLW